MSIFGIAKKGLGMLGRKRRPTETIAPKPSGKKDLTNVYKMKQSAKRTEKILKDTAKRQERIVKELKKRTEKK